MSRIKTIRPDLFLNKKIKQTYNIIFSFLKGPIFFFLTFLVLIFISFIIVEDWGILDTFYYFVVTFSTVGYGDLTPQTTLGRILAILLILVSIGSIAWVTGKGLEIVRLFYSGDILSNYKILDFEDHLLIIGEDEMVYKIEESFRKMGFPILIITSEDSKFKKKSALILRGNLQNKETYQKARVSHAAAVLVFLHDMEEEVNCLLTIRAINSNVPIILSKDQTTTRIPSSLRSKLNVEIIRPDEILYAEMVQFLSNETENIFLSLPGDFRIVSYPINETIQSQVNEIIKINSNIAVLGYIDKKSTEFQNDLPTDSLNNYSIIILGEKSQIYELESKIKLSDFSSYKKVLFVGYGDLNKILLAQMVKDYSISIIEKDNNKVRLLKTDFSLKEVYEGDYDKILTQIPPKELKDSLILIDLDKVETLTVLACLSEKNLSNTQIITIAHTSQDISHYLMYGSTKVIEMNSLKTKAILQKINPNVHFTSNGIITSIIEEKDQYSVKKIKLGQVIAIIHNEQIITKIPKKQLIEQNDSLIMFYPI